MSDKQWRYLNQQIQFKMMKQKMSIHDIFLYLGQKNFNLTSEKVLKDPLGNPDIIWNILIFLTQNIRDTKFDQVQPTLLYLLDDSHKNSIRKIKQYSILCETLKKIYRRYQYYYPFKEILKPQKEFVQEKISTLICVNKYWEKIVKKFDSKRTYFKLKKLQVQSQTKKLETLIEEIEEMKTIKQKQRKAFEQKQLSIQNLTKDFNYKRKQKLDLQNSQFLLEAEKKKKAKNCDEQVYNNHDLSIKIKQLERKIVRNAPKLKRDRMEKKEKYQKLMKRNGDYFDLLKKKIKVFNEKIMQSEDVKYKSKSVKIAKRFKQLSYKIQKSNKIMLAISRATESKKLLVAQKKQYLKSLQILQKKKKERMSRIAQKEKDMGIMKKAQKVMRDDLKINKRNIKIFHQKYTQSKNQYKTLTDKFKHKRQRMWQKLFEIRFRIKILGVQINDIFEETFQEIG